MERSTNNFIVYTYSTRQRKQIAISFSSKTSAEGFRNRCKPTEYLRPVVYPIQLFYKLHGDEHKIINGQDI